MQRAPPGLRGLIQQETFTISPIPAGQGLGGLGVAGTAVTVGRAAVFRLGDPFPAAPRRPGTPAGFLPEASSRGHPADPGLTSLGLSRGREGSGGSGDRVMTRPLKS